ncbi:hypothetical protein A3G67_01555 [Candidatus Roizmanbacteria bacterium RIFCSPLOWO2_12_FULL_40_12]|nr:MAG: hypothetical protein A2779_02460 [Candidatus Roizmanbacteria bacterium RIFCSPHIGHO2_01_FULL_40_98]OGK29817.1 MAG: hypothetical protein A2W49_04580 [Candidatus Roizmanbacteria bacterium RIFCSPHIGHO2_12_41_18]OGK36224.1 MAG: hypothetical protein A3E69_01285 [Candidatus Roizmanbacteria bacterium RIFCSPHIGHO2_12_FULL_40_130]OGK61175.1 MAG: hypothetical protein A3G67_01555 [Candidatus Roizmanbacteria bacterium RIFCSPLOWO2_12_FULL_40_12]
MKTEVKREILKQTFLWGFFISSFLIWPWSSFIYELPRIWFVRIWIEALLLFGLFFGLPHLKKKHHDGLLIGLVLILCAISFFASFVGIDSLQSFFGNAFRDNGIFTFMHLIGLFFFLALFWEKTWEKEFVTVIALSSFLNAILTIVLGLVFKAPFTGTFGQNSFLAGYILVTTPFIVQAYENSRNKFSELIWFCALVINVFVVLLSKSLGGIIGILLLIAGIFLKNTALSKRQIFYTLLFSGILLGAAFFFIKISGPFTFESRERILMRGVNAFTQKPFTGWGWANFDYAFRSVDWPIRYEHDIYVDKAHGVLLEFLVTTGIFGLLAYLAILIRFFLRFLRENTVSYYAFLSLLLFVIHSQTNIISISEELIFWILLGIVASQAPKLRTS